MITKLLFKVVIRSLCIFNQVISINFARKYRELLMLELS